jgi:hypothetical protein
VGSDEITEAERRDEALRSYQAAMAATCILLEVLELCRLLRRGENGRLESDIAEKRC